MHSPGDAGGFGPRTNLLPTTAANSRPSAPFWNYYGAKWRDAPHYPAPRHATIIEPFAGAAGYSLRYAERRVILVEKNPIVAAVWRWLIASAPVDVLAIPEVDHIDDLPASVCQEARWLVGFSLNDGTTAPRKALSAGRRKLREKGCHFQGWCAARRARVAAQVDSVKHWRIIEGDYTAAPGIDATWFVDPPYQLAGKYYPHRLAAEDYAPLAAWCHDRKGQVIVCEAMGADWLPFAPFRVTRAGPTRQRHAEAIWLRDTDCDGSLALAAGPLPPRTPLPLTSGVSAASPTESKNR